MQSNDEKSALLGTGGETKEQVSGEKAKGARPKIRNPKEAKRRRFVMKQAKTIAKPQQLESVSETEEGTTLLSRQGEKPPEDAARRHQEFFGVRSYVHTFYEAMAMDNSHSYDFPGGGGRHAPVVRKRRKQILCWRAALCSGVLILAMGLTAILVGFLVPKRKEVVDVQEDIEIINRADQAFNRDLDVCKVVGIVLFCAGGAMVTIVLLASLTLMRRPRVEEDLEEDIPMEEVAADLDPGPGTPMDAKVPATEELAAVQPKRLDPEEVVMTNAGLCKVP